VINIIEISLHLYGKPSWDLDIEGKSYIDPLIFKKHADHMRDHLYFIGEVLEKLQENNWKVAESYGAIYALSVYKEGVDTKEDAEKELIKIGIDPEEIDIMELEDEDDDDDTTDLYA